jgi:hypothetical protein
MTTATDELRNDELQDDELQDDELQDDELDEVTGGVVISIISVLIG